MSKGLAWYRGEGGSGTLGCALHGYCNMIPGTPFGAETKGGLGVDKGGFSSDIAMFALSLRRQDVVPPLFFVECPISEVVPDYRGPKCDAKRRIHADSQITLREQSVLAMCPPGFRCNSRAKG